MKKKVTESFRAWEWKSLAHVLQKLPCKIVKFASYSMFTFVDTNWKGTFQTSTIHYSLCFIKFVDQIILLSQKAAFQFQWSFLDFSHIISTTNIMNNMFSHITGYIWYVFILVKTVLDCYANGKYSYKRFQSVLGAATENHLCFTKLYTKTL